MEEYKIFSYLNNLTDAYQEPISLVDGLIFNHKKVLRTIEFYCNNEFESGKYDELGREKPFYNVGNYRVTVAKIGTDIDVKDIKYEPDSLDNSVPAMIINHELFKYLKSSNFSETLNDMGKTRPKYGGLLVKKHDGKDMDIEVVEWKNVDCDPVDILGAPLIETHYLLPSELLDKNDVWDKEQIKEALKAHNKANKNKPTRITIKEVTGEFPANLDPKDESEENDIKYKTMCFYIGEVGKKKFYFYKEDIKDIEDKYMYLAWEKVPGRGLGRGVIEEGFESQVWTNDAMISMKNAMTLTSKVLLWTDSQKISGNAITGVKTGHIFQGEQGRSMQAINLGSSKLPELEKVIDLWGTQFDKISSTYDANTGEAPTAGTPYSQTALLNQVANSPLEYQREVWGIFLNRILNRWILPHLKKQITKEHYLVSEFGEEELKLIDETIKNREGNSVIKETMLKGDIPSPFQVEDMNMGVEKALSAFGSKREVEVPESFLNVDGKITANITGELKNKQAVLQSLSQIGRDIAASFNPATGQYAALENPTLRSIYGMIVDAMGTPLTSASLKPSTPTQMPAQIPSQMPAQPDLSAIAPMNG